MAKTNETVFMCSDCGNEFKKWLGKCTACKAFGTIKETKLQNAPSKKSRQSNWAGNEENGIKSASDIQKNKSSITRIDTKIGELNRVLGGALTKGSVVLLGGEPGVGKSTLLIQAMAAMSDSTMQCLYVTGEESLEQVTSRGDRLKLNMDNISFLSETCVESIIYQSEKNKKTILVVDSIQTIYTETSDSTAGSPSQVRDSTAKLTAYAKSNNITIILIGHVTKEGSIAGPKVLEHMVDTVLSFEGERGSRYKMLRATKNRFGQVNELGVFAMLETGLKEVKNPSSLFLSSENEAASGSSIMVSQEGTRPLLFEVQSLVSESFLEMPALVPIGLNYQRIRMILAIMQKHTSVKTFGQDVYINVVGGIQIPSTETSCDLAVCFSLLSSIDDFAIPKKIAAFGELSLSGEVRPVPNGEERILEAQKHGLEYIIVPKANVSPQLLKKATIKIIAVTNIMEAIEKLQAIIK